MNGIQTKFQNKFENTASPQMRRQVASTALRHQRGLPRYRNKRPHSKIDPIRDLFRLGVGFLVGVATLSFKRRLSSAPMRRMLSTQDGGVQCNSTEWYNWLVYEDEDNVEQKSAGPVTETRRTVNWFPTKLYTEPSSDEDEVDILAHCRSKKDEAVLENDNILKTKNKKQKKYDCTDLGSPWTEFPSMTLK